MEICAVENNREEYWAQGLCVPVCTHMCFFMCVCMFMCVLMWVARASLI